MDELERGLQDDGGTTASDAIRMLEKAPELKELKYSIGAIAEQRRCPMPSPLVTIQEYAGIPHYHRIGAPPEGVKLHSKLSVKSGMRSKSISVAVRAKEFTRGDPQEWYAIIIAFVSISFLGSSPERMAFVKWLEADTQADSRFDGTRFVPLQVQKDRRINPRGTTTHTRTVDFTDLVPLRDILRPVFIQPNPLQRKRYLYNGYVR